MSLVMVRQSFIPEAPFPLQLVSPGSKNWLRSRKWAKNHDIFGRGQLGVAALSVG